MKPYYLVSLFLFLGVYILALFISTGDKTTSESCTKDLIKPLPGPTSTFEDSDLDSDLELDINFDFGDSAADFQMSEAPTLSFIDSDICKIIFAFDGNELLWMSSQGDCTEDVWEGAELVFNFFDVAYTQR